MSEKINEVFQSFTAIHVDSQVDVVLIKQGDIVIALPAPMVPTLIAALELTHRGEL